MRSFAMLVMAVALGVVLGGLMFSTSKEPLEVLPSAVASPGNASSDTLTARVLNIVDEHGVLRAQIGADSNRVALRLLSKSQHPMVVLGVAEDSASLNLSTSPDSQSIILQSRPTGQMAALLSSGPEGGEPFMTPTTTAKFLAEAVAELQLVSAKGTRLPTEPKSSEIQDQPEPDVEPVRVISNDFVLVPEGKTHSNISWRVGLSNESRTARRANLTVFFKNSAGMVVSKDLQINILLAAGETRTISDISFMDNDHAYAVVSVAAEVRSK